MKQVLGKQLLATGLIVVALFVSLPLRAAEKLPDQTAREVTDQIVKLIKENRDSYLKDNKKLYEMVDKNLLPHFDFRKVSQQVLGPRWREASDDQRNRFTGEFRDLLVRTYATALLKYNNEKIVYHPIKMKEDDRTVIVKSTVHRTDGGPSVNIDYSFYKRDGEWKIYDMAVEGPSVVTTYRRVYADKLQKQNLDQLIDGIAKENRRATTGGAG